MYYHVIKGKAHVRHTTDKYKDNFKWIFKMIIFEEGILSHSIQNIYRYQIHVRKW